MMMIKGIPIRRLKMREAEEYQEVGPVSIEDADAMGWCPDEPAWRDDDRMLLEAEEAAAGMEALAAE
jgi:hypothetical protein